VPRLQKIMTLLSSIDSVSCDVRG